jgi:hypothetical protein
VGHPRDRHEWKDDTADRTQTGVFIQRRYDLSPKESPQRLWASKAGLTPWRGRIPLVYRTCPTTSHVKNNVFCPTAKLNTKTYAESKIFTKCSFPKLVLRQ